MKSAIIRVVARLVPKQEAIEAFKSAAAELVEATRKEKGCLGYELLQSLTDATDFTFIEAYADSAALDAHMNAPHLHAALAKVGPLLAAKPDIRRYTTVI